MLNQATPNERSESRTWTDGEWRIRYENEPPPGVSIVYGDVRRDKKYSCPVHGAISAVFSIVRVNEGFETVYEHFYCLDCYDAMLQKHLPVLKEIRPNEATDSN